MIQLNNESDCPGAFYGYCTEKRKYKDKRMEVYYGFYYDIEDSINEQLDELMLTVYIRQISRNGKRLLLPCKPILNDPLKIKIENHIRIAHKTNCVIDIRYP